MKTIVCYGDSNTWGYDSQTTNRFPRGVRWTSLLQEALPDCCVIEEGLSGRTTVFEDDMRAGRCGLSFLTTVLKTHDPIDLVIFMLGTNDCKTRFRACAAEITEGMQQLVELVHAPGLLHLRQGPKVLIIAPPPLDEEAISKGAMRFMFSPESVATSQELARFYKEMAQCTGILFFDAGEVASVGVDGVHLDPKGHAGLATALADYLLALME